MRVAAKTKDELFFGELFDNLFGVTAVLTNDATEVALQKNALLCELVDVFIILVVGMVAFRVRKNNLPASVLEAE